MLSIDAVERVLDKRSARGTSDESLIIWLESLKLRAWKGQPSIIDGFIDAIRQTPASCEWCGGLLKDKSKAVHDECIPF